MQPLVKQRAAKLEEALKPRLPPVLSSLVDSYMGCEMIDVATALPCIQSSLAIIQLVAGFKPPLKLQVVDFRYDEIRKKLGCVIMDDGVPVATVHRKEFGYTITELFHGVKFANLYPVYIFELLFRMWRSLNAFTCQDEYFPTQSMAKIFQYESQRISRMVHNTHADEASVRMLAKMVLTCARCLGYIRNITIEPIMIQKRTETRFFDGGVAIARTVRGMVKFSCRIMKIIYEDASLQKLAFEH